MAKSPISFFFFNDTATTEIYTLSLHDALPICGRGLRFRSPLFTAPARPDHAVLKQFKQHVQRGFRARSEEHTSELQSPDHLVCRLLLEKKKLRLPCHHAFVNRVAAGLIGLVYA